MSQSLFSSRCKKGFKKFEILKNSNLSLCLLFLDHFFAHKLQTDEPLLSGGLGRMWRIDGGIRTDDFLYNVYLLFVLLYIFEWDLSVLIIFWELFIYKSRIFETLFRRLQKASRLSMSWTCMKKHIQIKAMLPHAFYVFCWQQPRFSNQCYNVWKCNTFQNMKIYKQIKAMLPHAVYILCWQKPRFSNQC